MFFLSSLTHAANQSDFYLREEIPLPPGEVMEIGSIALMPEQKIAVTTRRGDLWICSGAYGDDLNKVTWKKFAQGLHEPFGMFWKAGWLYLTQRPEVTRLKDSTGSGVADTFETINSDWGIKGDYHEYAFGSDPDKNGDIWVVLCLTGSFTADSDWRGWCAPHHPGRENDSHLLRHPLARRHRLQCRGRRLLHRQPRPLERLFLSQMAQARLFPRQSHRK